MRDKERLFSVRLHENFDIVKLDQACQDLATNKSRLTQEGLEIVMNLSPSLWERLKSISKSRNYPVWALVQTMIADYLARYDAEAEVYGIPKGFFMLQLDCQGKPADGSRIYDVVKLNHRRDMELEKRAELEDKSRSGYPLSEDERTFIRQQRAPTFAFWDPEDKKQVEEELERQRLNDETLRRDIDSERSK